jgi:large subunit ribosomal protein L2
MNYKLFKNPLLKKKLIGLKNSSGRNSFGRITINHRGSGHKKKIRLISFNRPLNSKGILISLEYDPNRNTYISCIYDFIEKNYFYMLLPKKSRIGDIVQSGTFAKLKLGNNLKLSKIPVGSYIHNVSIIPDKKGIISRAAGTFTVLIEKNNKYARLKISSGEQKFVSINCTATLGVVSNEHHILTNLGKAGRSRWLNRRPTVRGVAMNPVDHPHGGGEGKTSGGKILLTPWGNPTKNKKTRKKK